MIELVKVTQTCGACPSQWDAWDAEGRYYYLRYRWGCGTVSDGTPDGPEVEDFLAHAGMRVAAGAEIS